MLLESTLPFWKNISLRGKDADYIFSFRDIKQKAKLIGTFYPTGLRG